MKTQTFTAVKGELLSKFIPNNLHGAGFAFVRTLLKNKDIKVNGARVSADVMLSAGDTVQIFYPDDAIKEYKPYKIIFEDKNILVVHKNQGIETTSAVNKNTLENLLSANFKKNLIAVHRLDVNTEGLVIFAKNETARTELENAFKEDFVEKTYNALCFGTLNKSPLTLTGYLKKDSGAGEVVIAKEQSPGFLPIKTTVEFVRNLKDFGLYKITPRTGRTHQIRAHLASIGLYIVGDGKYGDAKLNKAYGETKQALCATEIKFKFPPASPLAYLNKEIFKTVPSFLK
ncbi:MAG: RluA family pseudouridine synthase [Christensenellaceae bacterium]|jgi:23S rRNA pseudouridine955/2504/2580 synthase|nr:RluA family pseudouridine synthase [Christensenellaceae bacterium]